MHFILASKSPRRKELLKNIISDFDVEVADIDETFKDGLTIIEQSKNVSYLKANKIYKRTTGDRIVIASDTIVYKDNKLYGKPRNEEVAFKYLKELSGKKHQVITSLCVLINDNGNLIKKDDCVVTDVYFDDLSDDEINDWIKTGNVLDKAGAYAIQDTFTKHIRKIDGDYNSVIGLPINKLYSMIKDYL